MQRDWHWYAAQRSIDSKVVPAIWKKSLIIPVSSLKYVSSGNFSTTPLLCVLVYRPPKTDKDVIKEFYDLISHIIASYDHLLILGDFNIHVCWPGKPLVTELTCVLDSFGFIQHVDKATQVLSPLLCHMGLPVNNINIEDASFYKLIVFSVIICSSLCTAKTTGLYQFSHCSSVFWHGSNKWCFYSSFSWCWAFFKPRKSFSL